MIKNKSYLDIQLDRIKQIAINPHDNFFMDTPDYREIGYSYPELYQEIEDDTFDDKITP